MSENRRKHNRYKVANAVSVSSDGIFQISDISLGGFCIKCPPYTSIPDFFETDILTSIVSLENPSVKRIWLKMAKKSVNHDFLPMVLCGIKFERLNKDQRDKLSQLIQTISHKNIPEQ